MTFDISQLNFDSAGLIPAVVQDDRTKEVLTVAYMNEESLQKSLETRETWFYSRSRQELWHKGATSGNTQAIREIRFDCDQDALVVLVSPEGPACHRGTVSCFTETLMENREEENAASEEDTGRFAIIEQLERTIKEREVSRPEGSYTTYLFDEGVDKILKKVGEEASEVIIASKNRSKEELTWETADLLYHLLVLLEEQKLPLDRILERLEDRFGKQHLKK
ncbi:bifunctional phosphoribosyl-AMP cyclohydrolase/phosphoribosyl-ATP diphosphatase HisIE [Alteribacter natronophilus]|uniref:bifunctional phosphoribosyl-AMP cyclohydrolase/phosphoribosyl-ATP diphosphatase HisIE n=1 Tax=Alteribacter natronophilus TaxID=2583810 RepID=UPI00110F68FF|nr:bifunctional phosphoribosyl-AMP cyclohydrolase/phosphoribosyl-ATP diphosphatase HisIE [Alteribacter natronophilus]TMW72417.1 bifunctional phosphoribosyl-AMP cyclohydrolase/phosphoribosyl-ATP diphosphatase HisIE [Alteribacter natronophilus]